MRAHSRQFSQSLKTKKEKKFRFLLSSSTSVNTKQKTQMTFVYKSSFASLPYAEVFWRVTKTNFLRVFGVRPLVGWIASEILSPFLRFLRPNGTQLSFASRSKNFYMYMWLKFTCEWVSWREFEKEEEEDEWIFFSFHFRFVFRATEKEDFLDRIIRISFIMFCLTFSLRNADAKWTRDAFFQWRLRFCKIGFRCAKLRKTILKKRNAN